MMVLSADDRRVRLGEWRSKEFPGFDPWHFNTRVLDTAGPSMSVLEIGSGSGEGLQTRMPLKGRVAKYVGVDVDERVKTNPNLDVGVVCDAKKLPFPDSSFDLVFHTMVAEHLDSPKESVAECLRVLKPNGKILIHTVSLWYYGSIVAALTPHWFHRFYVKHLGLGRLPEDVFPTRYKFNTRRQINKIAKSLNVDVDLEFIAVPPAYLAFSRLAWQAGVLYSKAVESWLPAARSQLICTIQKPQTAAEDVSDRQAA